MNHLTRDRSERREWRSCEETRNDCRTQSRSPRGYHARPFLYSGVHRDQQHPKSVADNLPVSVVSSSARAFVDSLASSCKAEAVYSYGEVVDGERVTWVVVDAPPSGCFVQSDRLVVFESLGINEQLKKSIGRIPSHNRMQSQSTTLVSNIACESFPGASTHPVFVVLLANSRIVSWSY